MRSRIPLAYAGLLVIALVAVLGFAAFGTGAPWNAPTTAADQPTPLSTSEPISARVASAVLALAVNPQPEATQAPTTTTGDTPTTAPAPTAEVEANEAPATTETTAAAAATTAPASTTATAGDTTPPRLTVDSPEDGSTVRTRVVTFSGTTEPGANVFSGPYAADVTDDGSWQLALVLSAGDNGAIISARDAAGNETEVRLVVTYQPESTTTEPPATTTTSGGGATTTTAAPSPKYSPVWPADSPGRRNVETWRDEVAAYWPAERVDCALGLIVRESHGDPAAYNSRTDVAGLFQHRVPYWAGRAAGAGFVDGNGLVASPFNGEANIAAAAYLANYYASRSFWAAPWGYYTEADLPSYGTCGS